MDRVTIRELRNHGGDVVDRVINGESLIVTRSGRPVAELKPLRKQPLDAATLLTRRRHLPEIDPDRLRRDIDGMLDQRL